MEGKDQWQRGALTFRWQLSRCHSPGYNLKCMEESISYMCPVLGAHSPRAWHLARQQVAPGPAQGASRLLCSRTRPQRPKNRLGTEVKAGPQPGVPAWRQQLPESGAPKSGLRATPPRPESAPPRQAFPGRSRRKPPLRSAAVSAARQLQTSAAPELPGAPRRSKAAEAGHAGVPVIVRRAGWVRTAGCRERTAASGEGGSPQPGALIAAVTWPRRLTLRPHPPRCAPWAGRPWEPAGCCAQKTPVGGCSASNPSRAWEGKDQSCQENERLWTFNWPSPLASQAGCSNSFELSK